MKNFKIILKICCLKKRKRVPVLSVSGYDARYFWPCVLKLVNLSHFSLTLLLEFLFVIFKKLEPENCVVKWRQGAGIQFEIAIVLFYLKIVYIN